MPDASLPLLRCHFHTHNWAFRNSNWRIPRSSRFDFASPPIPITHLRGGWERIRPSEWPKWELAQSLINTPLHIIGPLTCSPSYLSNMQFSALGILDALPLCLVIPLRVDRLNPQATLCGCSDWCFLILVWGPSNSPGCCTRACKLPLFTLNKRSSRRWKAMHPMVSPPLTRHIYLGFIIISDVLMQYTFKAGHMHRPEGAW